MDFSAFVHDYGPVAFTAVVGLIGALGLLVVNGIRKTLDRVETNTADLPAVRVQLQTLGREMGERKNWENSHLERYHPIPHHEGD